MSNSQIADSQHAFALRVSSPLFSQMGYATCTVPFWRESLQSGGMIQVKFHLNILEVLATKDFQYSVLFHLLPTE